MKFFVPAAEDAVQTADVYAAFAKFVNAEIRIERIWKLRWQHNGMDMACEVGQPLPKYFGMGDEPVLAIFDCDRLYKICTPNRGGLRGEPVMAGKDEFSSVTYFDPEDADERD